MIYGSPVGQIWTRMLDVGKTPTAVSVDPRLKAKGRTAIEIYVPHTADVSAVYIGGHDVTTQNGIPIPVLSSKIIPVNRDAVLYLVADMSTQVIVAEYTP